MSGEEALAFKFRVGQIEKLTENLLDPLTDLFAVFGGHFGIAGLLGQAFQILEKRADPGAQHAVRQLQPTPGRIHVGLVLGRGIEVVTGGQHAVGSGGIVRRPVDLLLGGTLLVAFHIGRQIFLHLADHIAVHHALGNADSHTPSTGVINASNSRRRALPTLKRHS